MSHHVSSNLAISQSQFPSLLIGDLQVETLCNVTYGQTLYGNHSKTSLSLQEQGAFVGNGLARHRQGATVIDEPLAILAAMRWLTQSPNASMFNHPYRDIGMHSPRQNCFEAYLAFYLRQVFETAPGLDEVFTFRSNFADLAWKSEEFELVTVVNTNPAEPKVSVVTPSSGPSSNIGLKAESAEIVVEWLSTNKGHATFCFPPNLLGPDLLFFIRSKSDEKLLLIVIQAKKYQKVETPVSMKAVRTVTPSWFWTSKEMKVCSFLQTGCICFE